jgi:hypothetical protein
LPVHIPIYVPLARDAPSSYEPAPDAAASLLRLATAFVALLFARTAPPGEITAFLDGVSRRGPGGTAAGDDWYFDLNGMPRGLETLPFWRSAGSMVT